MHARLLALALVLAAGAAVIGLTRSHANDTVALPFDSNGTALPQKVDFAQQIQPILTNRCMPCHFPGGTMYEQLPFDQAKTVHTLGEKLFTRIKNDTEQELIRTFLAQGQG